MEAKPMKGISCCGDCGYYNWKKHECSRFCKDEGDPRFPFYRDCPLPDVVEQKPQKWIPVTKRLPETHDEYLVVVDGVDPAVRYVSVWIYQPWCGRWADGDDDFVVKPDTDGEIRYWMEMPKPPKEEEDD